MECFEEGLLSEKDTGGFGIRFGDGEAIVRAVEMIAHSEGFGRKMAMGAAHLAQEIGPEAEALLMTVKKLEMPYHEPRFKFAIGLGYTVAPVGADHMMNVHDTNYLENGAGLKRLEALEVEIDPQPLDSLAEEKVRAFTHEVNWQHFQDTAVTCMFFPYQYYHLADALSGATGWDVDAHDVITIGERANTLTRLYNVREGITAEQDRLPKRFFKAFTEGPLRGVAPTPEQMEKARRIYYELMGWDPETGVPSAERLQKLDLDWAVEILSSVS
jgi:aldehyde:ferredoxin oxidoreductase